MTCDNSEGELEIRDRGAVICKHCHQPREIKIGGVFTNVPEFKFNNYLVFIAILLAAAGTYFNLVPK